MDNSEIAEYCSTDPNSVPAEKEFMVGFCKDDDRARVSSSIASQVKRLLTHSDVIVDRITVYNETDETYSNIAPNEFDGNGSVVSCVGTVPIESLKIQSNPRSQRSYSNIISGQTEVNIDG